MRVCPSSIAAAPEEDANKDAVYAGVFSPNATSWAGEPFQTGASPDLIQIEAEIGMLSFQKPASIDRETVNGTPLVKHSYAKDKLWLTDTDAPLIVRAETNGSVGTHLLTVERGDVEHPLLPSLARLQRLVVYTPDTKLDHLRAGMAGAQNFTWTVVGEGNTSVKTSEIVLAVRAGSTERYAFPLSNGSAQDKYSRTAYVDTDGDGQVSPGDTVTIQVLANIRNSKDNIGDYSVVLHDTSTGLALRLS